MNDKDIRPLTDEEKELSIKNYISNKYSICREERQYAVFLYNVLRSYKKPKKRTGDIEEVFKACNLEGATIEKVFYEATFMRDFFERNRRLALSERYGYEERQSKIMLQKTFNPSKPKDGEKKIIKQKSFNHKLIEYVYKQKNEDAKVEYSGKECHLGQNDIQFEHLFINGENLSNKDDEDWLQYRVRWMMNAKPDIAVIYSDGNETARLLFIECKFESGESSYSYGKGAGQTMYQREIQQMIANFLSQEGYLGKINIKKENKEPRLVKFVREEANAANGEISIEQLIKLDDEIFEDKQK